MKRMSWMLGAVVVGVAALTGCSGSESKTASKESLTVQGSVSSRLGTDNARAVAIGEDGKKVWSYLDKKGDFTLRLPLGKSYRVLIANQLPGGGQKVIGKVSLKNGATKTQWLSANAAGKVSLGTLTRAETEVEQGSVAPKCFCPGDEGGKEGSAKGGDWGDEKDFDDSGDEKDSGYGDKTDKGNWDDGEWGGGGWEDDEDDVDSKKGDIEKDLGDESDHDDDNDCFGDDEEFFGDKKGWSGKGKDGAGKELEDEDLCDVCTDGGFVELEPSKKDAGKFGDVKGKKLDSLPESKACTKKSDVKKPTKPTDPKAEPTDKEPTDPKAEPTDKEPSKDTSDEEPIETKKDIGAKCFVKSECGVNSCVAAKCVAK